MHALPLRFVLRAAITVITVITVIAVTVTTFTVAACAEEPVACTADEVLGDACGLGCYDRPPSCIGVADDALCACLAAACAEGSDEACSAEANDIALRARDPELGACSVNADDVAIVRFATIDGCG